MDNARRICESLDLKRVMEDNGIEFNHSGFCRCFIHSEKTASMSVKGQHYKCFGCGAYGSVIDFIMEYHGIGFKQAMIRLDSDYNLNILGGHRPTRRDRLREAENRRMREVSAEVNKRYDEAYKTLTDLYRIASKTALELNDAELQEYADEMEAVLDTHSGMEAYAWLNL